MDIKLNRIVEIWIIRTGSSSLQSRGTDLPLALALAEALLWLCIISDT